MEGGVTIGDTWVYDVPLAPPSRRVTLSNVPLAPPSRRVTLSNVPLAPPSRRVTLSNVPPFIADEVLERELCRCGKIVSPMRKVSSGCKSPLLKHVVSHRRQILMMTKQNEDISFTFNIKHDDFHY